LDRIGRNKVESRWGMIIRDLDREGERKLACMAGNQTMRWSWSLKMHKYIFVTPLELQP
jgi:hypothetical protein